jgi:iron(III) transport system permease protein
MTSTVQRSRDPRRSWSSRVQSGVRRLDVLFVGEAALLFTIIVVPMAFVLQRAFGADGAISLGNFVDLFSKASFLRSLSQTLIAAVLGTLGCFVVGISLAITAERIDLRITRLFRAAAFIPLAISPLGGAVAWAILASPNVGLIWQLLEPIGITYRPNLYSMQGIVFVYILFYTPYVFVILATALEGMDASIEEAAATFGASGWQRFRWVLLPLLRVPLASSGLVVFALMVEAFAIPVTLGRPRNINFLASYAYYAISQTPSDPSEAAAAAVVIMLIVLLAYVVRSRIVRSAAGQSTVQGKGFHAPPRIKAGPVGWVMVVLSTAYLLFAGLAPIVALVIAATRENLFFKSASDLFDTSTYSFANAFEYREVWEPILWNTIKVGVTVAIVGSLLAFIGSYQVSRPGVGRWRRLAIEGTATASLAVPGIVFGLAYLWVGVKTPLYGTVLLMILAYTSRNLAQGFQTLSGRFVQLGPDFEESAAVFGAKRRTRLTRVVAPLVSVNVVYAGLFLFIATVRELSAVLFIFRPENQVLAVQAFQFWYDGRFDVVAVITLLQTVLMVGALIVSNGVIALQRRGSGRRNVFRRLGSAAPIGPS